VLVISRFVIEEDEAAPFIERAHAALAALAARPGYRHGQLARSLDEPSHWCLVTEWESVGTYRRALGAFDVKVHATPLLAESLDEPSAYEPLATARPGGEVTIVASDRAGDPGR
jgi:heme oxygenase (mycobilin-producing)